MRRPPILHRTAFRRAAPGTLTCTALLGGLWLTATRAQSPAPTGQPLSFSHPTAISNPYLPLAGLHQDILTGTDGGVSARIERTARPTTHPFRIQGRTVQAMTVEDRDYTKGRLSEATRDYFAQADDGTVYYLGESVDEYRRGKIVGHGGAWLTGQHGARPGVLMPAHPKAGDRWRSEDVPGITQEDDEAVAVDETVSVPAGTYRHCVKVKETTAGEGPEYKYYAPGVGVVREVPEGGNMRLISHR